MELEQDKKIILFDGVCNLCNGAVTFIIKRDKNDRFRYAALQSEVGQALSRKHTINTSKINTIILIDEDQHYTKSAAALTIARSLSGGYPLLYGLMILPAFMRDWIYDGIARNRYRWFGKRESCMVATPELKKKFLHD